MAWAGTEVLAGKLALVTGGPRGIGRAIVERLAGDGAPVVFSFVRNQPAAEEAVAAVEAAGGQWLGRLGWRTTIDRARAARGRPGRLPRCGTDGRATHDQPP